MSPRISDGQRQVAAQLAQQQSDIDIARVRIEQLQEMVASFGAALARLLDTPPFTGGPKA
jgi:hypothetical protein